MKNNIIVFSLIAGCFTILSCKKQLDINTNPNNAIYSTPELVLPQAIVSTASNSVSFNTYGRQTVGYLANGGGVSGWGAIISYNYTTSDFSNLWSSSYNTIEDYQYVLNQSAGKPEYTYISAVARIMKAYSFQLLVDTYNDVPYSEAFKGTDKLQPKYDDAKVIYKDLADQIDTAIKQINAGSSLTEAPIALTTASDPMFGGTMIKWKQFANTVKLRLIVRAKDKVAFSAGNTTFDAAGFLTDDAMVNPGYSKIDGKQNPYWDAFAYSAADAARTTGAQYVPTPFILSFYTGIKALDVDRGKVIYKAWAGTNGATTPTNQLGYQGADAAKGATPNSWFNGTSATAYNKIGIFKGPDAGVPLITAAESYLLQAEANVRGITGTTGTAKTNFLAGIEASYRYLYKDNTGKVLLTTSGADSAAKSAANYQAKNTTVPIVNFDLATTDAMKIEAIITQKYIALNMINSQEAWNEFRRTGYPVSSASTADAKFSIASTVSESTKADRLPTRVLYPDSEFRYNPTNVPKGISPYTSKIFWAL